MFHFMNRTKGKIIYFYKNIKKLDFGIIIAYKKGEPPQVFH